MNPEFPFDLEPKGYSINFGSAITLLRKETAGERGTTDFTPIIENIRSKNAGEFILQPHPDARIPGTDLPEPPEPIKSDFQKKDRYKDLDKFFASKKDRKFFVFNDRTYHSPEFVKDNDDKLHDFLFVTEPSDNGKTALYIFDYPKDHFSYNGREYLKLRFAAELEDKKERIIYFDNGEENGFKVGLLSESKKNEAFLNENILLFADSSDPKKKTKLEAIPGIKVPIPNPDISYTLDYLLHFKEHLPEIAKFCESLQSPASQFEFMQEILSGNINADLITQQYPAVGAVMKLVAENDYL